MNNSTSNTSNSDKTQTSGSHTSVNSAAPLTASIRDAAHVGSEKIRETVQSGGLRNVADNVRDAASRFTDSGAKEIMDDASNMAEEFYDRASSFVTENKTAGLVVGAVAVGAIGFFLGRSSRR